LLAACPSNVADAAVRRRRMDPPFYRPMDDAVAAVVVSAIVAAVVVIVIAAIAFLILLAFLYLFAPPHVRAIRCMSMHAIRHEHDRNPLRRGVFLESSPFRVPVQRMRRWKHKRVGVVRAALKTRSDGGYGNFRWPLQLQQRVRRMLFRFFPFTAVVVAIASRLLVMTMVPVAISVAAVRTAAAADLPEQPLPSVDAPDDVLEEEVIGPERPVVHAGDGQEGGPVAPPVAPRPPSLVRTAALEAARPEPAPRAPVRRRPRPALVADDGDNVVVVVVVDLWSLLRRLLLLLLLFGISHALCVATFWYDASTI